MIGTILALFINWYMLGFVLVLVALAALCYFTLGPIKLVQIVLDARTWMGIVAAATLITLYASAQTIKHQAQTIQTTVTSGTSATDASKVLDAAAKTKAKRVEQQHVQQAVINQAATGNAEDDLLDELAKEQAAKPHI